MGKKLIASIERNGYLGGVNITRFNREELVKVYPTTVVDELEKVAVELRKFDPVSNLVVRGTLGSVNGFSIPSSIATTLDADERYDIILYDALDAATGAIPYEDQCELGDPLITHSIVCAQNSKKNSGIQLWI